MGNSLVPRMLVCVAVVVASACASLPELARGPAGTPGSSPPVSQGARTQPSPPLAAMEREVHEWVNRYRQTRGLSSLSPDPTLAALAREHSLRMAAGTVSFSHDGFEARYEAAHAALGVTRMAENLARNNYPVAIVARRVVDGWIESAGHRGNLEGAFRLAGVGVARSAEGDYFVTQLYAAR